MSLEWMDDALCAQVSTEEFFPEKGDSVAFAKTVCRGCPVRDECLRYALEQDITVGVWGGLSGFERRKLREGRDRRRVAAEANRDAVRRLIEAGLTPGEIAEQVGVSTRTVARIRAELEVAA